MIHNDRTINFQQPPVNLAERNRGPEETAGSDESNRTYNKVNEQMEEGPSPILGLLAKIMKYAIPTIAYIGAFVLIGVAFSITATAALATPFLLLVLSTGLMAVGGMTLMQMVCYDSAKEAQIQNLHRELDKAQKEKKNVSALEAMKNDEAALEKQKETKEKRIDALKDRKASKGLNEKEEKELEDLEKQLEDLEAKIERKRKWIRKLEKEAKEKEAKAKADAKG